MAGIQKKKEGNKSLLIYCLLFFPFDEVINH